MYVPWVEKDNKQSNFDVSTGRFVVASDNATINGVEVGRYLQTYAKTDFGPRLGLRLRPATAAAGRSSAAATACSGTSRRAAPRRRRRRISRSSRRRRPRRTSAPTSSLSNGLAAPPGVNPDSRRRAARRGRRSSTDFRDAHAHNFNVNVQRQFGTNYMIEAAYSGLADRRTRRSRPT